MSYIPEQNVMIINIPKNGTRTSYKVLRSLGYNSNTINGHVKASRAAEIIKDQYHTIPDIVANVREPISRYVSGLNHVFAQNHNVDLDEAIARSFTKERHIVFIEQHKMLDGEIPIKLFPMNQIHLLFEYIGYFGNVPVEGASIKRWCAEDVKNHSRYDEICERYKSDFRIWNAVSNDIGGMWTLKNNLK